MIMEMTKEEFKLLHLRPALYDNTIMNMNVVFDDKALWRTEAKVALSLGLQPGDAVEIFGEAVDFSGENHKYCHETFYMSGDVLTKFIEQFGFEHIKTVVCFKVKFRYLYLESDYDTDNEFLAFEVLDIHPQSENSSCISNAVQSANMNDYFMDGMK